MRFIIDIQMDDGVPEGTGLLFILAEMIKDAPLIVSTKSQFTVRDYLDEGEVKAVIRKTNSEKHPKNPKIPKDPGTQK